MSAPLIRFDVEADGIALLTVNRPEKRNALSGAVLAELDQHLDRLESDGAIRAAILTGSGEKAFVAGADIAEMAALDGPAAQAFSRLGHRVFRRLELLEKPVVAALNGFALGGGLELAMCCTQRFAAATAKCGMPEGRLGILPGFGGTQRLPRMVGKSRALRLLLTGEIISAEDAFAIGLVDRVLPPEQLLESCREWLRSVLANAPLAIAMLLRTVQTGLEMDLDRALEYESTAFGLIRSTADCTEGLQAFVEKRPAQFTGR